MKTFNILITTLILVSTTLGIVGECLLIFPELPINLGVVIGIIESEILVLINLWKK